MHGLKYGCISLANATVRENAWTPQGPSVKDGLNANESLRAEQESKQVQINWTQLNLAVHRIQRAKG